MNTLPFTVADRSLPPRLPARAQPNAFAEFSFVAFLLLVFVSLKPFAIRDMSVLPLGDSGAGQGDALRQVCYLGCFFAIAISSFLKNGTRVLGGLPIALAVLLGWCLATALWAPAHDIVLRRAGLEIIVTLSAMLAVQGVGPERAIAILRAVLGAILIVNFASILLVHQAVHLANETDRQLIGNWRGLYYHKNIAGAVCSITALLFFFRALDTKRAWDWLFFLGAVAFTAMTRSKTSIGLLPIALAAGMLFRATRPQSLERWIVLAAGGLALAVAALAIVVDLHAIERFLADPTELTGRVAIWKAEFSFIRDHPLLGSGFGSFADTGQLSPLYNYVADKWVQGEANGHNGYLQLCVTTGGAGFAVAILAFVVQPLRIFRRTKKREQAAFFAPLFGIFVFVVLHNFAESDFLEGDGPAWVAFLLMLACLQATCITQTWPVLAATPQWRAP